MFLPADFSYDLALLPVAEVANEVIPGDSIIIGLHENLPVFQRDGKNLGLPAAHEHKNITDIMKLGELNGKKIFAANLSGLESSFLARDLRRVFHRIDPGLLLFIGIAQGMMHWHRQTKYCGQCSKETEPGSENNDLYKQCSQCNSKFYPRLSPAVIVSITRGDSILLAHGQGLPPGMYSVLAGFVNPGESLEQAVAREVREEAGIEVKNTRYFKSQFWPFPDSLMIAFTAEYASGELVLDEREITDARWFRYDELPEIPGHISVARALIDDFVKKQSTASNG